MKKRLFYGFLVTGLSLNLFVGAHLYLQSAESVNKDDIYPNLELYSRVLELIRKDYVDGQKLSYQELVYNSLRGMVSTLDPHSEFMEPVKYTELRKDTEGAFGGVGIVIGIRDKALTVLEPMEDTPAMRAGVLPGDRVILIDGKTTEKFKLDDAVKRLRGEPGSEVEIRLSRPGSTQTRDVKLKRENIKVHKVKDVNGKREFPLSEDKVGYVRLLQFDEQTTKDLDDALKRLKSQGMRSLVLDLRGNPGGLLDQAVQVCERFLPKDQLIVSTEGRREDDRERYAAQRPGKHQDLTMAVLVNGSSASASEIVAGCLQDVKRAIIVGEQTFGKGSVQKIIPLPNGCALRLTTSKYYTPSHKVIHEKGITPDIEVLMGEDEEQALYLKRTPGAIDNLEEALSGLDDEKKERMRKLVVTVRDVQLDRAVDMLKGIYIYGQRKKQGPVATK